MSHRIINQETVPDVPFGPLGSSLAELIHSLSSLTWLALGKKFCLGFNGTIFQQ